MADDLELSPCPRGTRFRLRVKPGARKTAILGVHGGALKIAVSAPPERGKANRAVVALVGETLGLPSAAITIASGETSKNKVIEVAAEAAVVREALTRALADLN